MTLNFVGALGAMAVAVTGLPIEMNVTARVHPGPYFHPGSHVPGMGELPTVRYMGQADLQWEWHEVAGTQCMDKKTTGFWIRKGNPKKLMVYLMGGGACFNDLCDTLATSSPKGKGFETSGPPMSGILRQNTGAAEEVPNPLGDHTAVFVPYCTGDVFFGNQDTPQSMGFLTRGKKIFMGRQHLNLVMESLKDSSYLPSGELEHFVLTGESAGGFGSLANYDFVRTNFVSDTEVALNTHWTINKAKEGRALLIDDSGVVMSESHLTKCLTKRWVNLFNLASTVPPDCPECADSLYAIYPFLQKKYKDDVAAFISTNSDDVITLFYGYGFTKANGDGECGNALLPGSDPTSFKAGIEEFFNEFVLGDNKFASYFFDGTDHTHSTQDEFFYKMSVFNDMNNGNPIKLVDWYQNIVDGLAMDVESSLFYMLNKTTV